MMRRKCCSVIVTHNRKKLLLRNIKRNLMQTVGQDIIIIDNASSDGTEEYLSYSGVLDSDRIIYKHKEKNDFGSGGFNAGLEYAFAQGYECVWLMDDDGFPKNDDALEQLLEASEYIDTKEWILNSVVVGNNYSLAFEMGGIKNIKQLEKKRFGYESESFIFDISPFNGTLISRDVFYKIGNIRKEFVIHGDEREYIERGRHKGVFVRTVKESVFFHPKVSAREYYLGDCHGWYKYRFPWMEYYEARNHICIKKWYGSDEDVNDYIDGIKKKIICAPYDVKDYDYYINKGIEAGLNEDFTPLSNHPAMKYVENANKSDIDRLLERYSRQTCLLSNWLDRKELGLSIADDLLDRGIKSVAIYGMNEFGRHAAIELKESGFDVKYVMDKNPDADSCGYRLLSLDDELEEVDAVIVTIFKWATSVKQALAKKLPDAEILEIDELL